MYYKIKKSKQNEIRMDQVKNVDRTKHVCDIDT